MIRRAKQLRTRLNWMGDIALWTGLVFCTALAGHACSDFNRREQERLERVHLDGVAVGATMCTKGRP
ncbi:hypothetical protein [Variovorax paradoxus]|uniref:Uncharacterized protein n=1 Tax=Variovorax paradoxus TaxID=34073 RepID=A0A0H2MCL0_VARPD|nr:hypothetical protein [Variovorax paradoxus]KLN54710.1 hypothetical protein VPARA_40140 [Variovorax paradoxus]